MESTSRVSKGLTSALLRGKSTLEEGPPAAYLAFSFIFVFPLPSSTTEAEEASFAKEFLAGQRTHQSIMDGMAIHKVARSDSKFGITCGESLKSMRNATIEIFQSFFKTMFGDDPGCRLVQFTSMDNTKLFMCVAMSDRLAEQFADMADYPLQLDIRSLEKLGIKIQDSRGVVPAYVRFDAFQKDAGLLRLYQKPESPEETCVLRRVDRIRLLYDKITDYVDLPEMELMGLVNYLPCHNVATLAQLNRKWARNSRVLLTLTQPIDRIRNYFGESVAFYFLFVQELSRAMVLLVPFAGLAECGRSLLPAGSAWKDGVASAYSLLLVVWFISFNKHWRRTEAEYGNLWGMDRRPSNAEIRELVNPQFSGELKPWPIDENEMVEEPIRSKLLLGSAISGLGQFFFIALIVLSVSVTQYRASREDAQGHSSAHNMAALAVSAQIQVFGFAWEYVAAWLTDKEQHPTMSAWHESKARKKFVVGFINTFFSFFYVGFFQGLVDPRALSSQPLRTNMVIVYGSYIVFGLLDIAMPLLEYYLKIFFEARELRQRGGVYQQGAVSFLEMQAKLPKYSGESLAADYMQVFFSLAFVVLFSVVMPLLTVCLALCTFVLQLRVDAWKLLHTYRRVFPDMADGIGLWNNVMRSLEFLSICVNLCLLITHYDAVRFFTWVPGVRESLNRSPTVTKALMFFIALNIFRMCKASFDYIVPDEPERTSLEKKRQDLQIARLKEREAEFQEGATMWASGDPEASAFHQVPPLRPGDEYFVEHV
mmetsp:Transcript_106665/g.318859  ORF Transcript_106665/g.318859 Transcript_106665/m.318859 type:complete len:765 (-) Transcript_106665:42-2336(-)